MSKFINPAAVVGQMGLKNGQVVADLGVGSGFYALPAAKLVGTTGTVYAVDVQEARLAASQSAARQSGLKNITAVLADLDKPLLDIPETSCDAVILASIIHEVGSREALLKNAYRLLKTGGRLLAVEWKKELTPLGPALEKRITREELEQLLTNIGLRKEKNIDADSYHYATVFIK